MIARGGEMDNHDKTDWMQILGFGGLIASLVFVGLELRQSREIAIADVYQQRAAMLIDVHSITLTSELLYDTYNKATSGEPLNSGDQILMATGLTPIFTYWENNHFQYEMGLLSEEQWESSQNAMKAVLRRPDVQLWWQTERAEVRKTFADVVDDLLAE